MDGSMRLIQTHLKQKLLE